MPSKEGFGSFGDLPDWARTLLEILGVSWPAANQHRFQRLGSKYDEVGDRLAGAPDKILQTEKKVHQNYSGEASLYVRDSMKPLTDGSPSLLSEMETAARGVADSSRKIALDIEYTKYSAVGQLFLLAYEIAMEYALASVTGGLSLANLTWQYAATRMFLVALFKHLARVAVMETFIGISGGLIIDAVVQRLQHERDAWDTETTRQTALSGFIGGIIGGGIGELGEYLGRRLGSLLGKDYTKFAVADLERLTKDLKLPTGVPDTWTRDLGRTLSDRAGRQLSAPGLAFTRSATDRFGEDVAKHFVTAFGKTLGDDAARELGRQYAKAFVDNWARHGLDEAGTKELRRALGDVLQPHAKDLGDGATGLLRDHVPDVLARNAMDRLGGNLAYKAAMYSTMFLAEGASGIASMAAMGVINSEDSSAGDYAMGFLSGTVMGGVGHLTEHYGEKALDFAVGSISDKMNLLRGDLDLGAPTRSDVPTAGGVSNLGSGTSDVGDVSDVGGVGDLGDVTDLDDTDDTDDVVGYDTTPVVAPVPTTTTSTTTTTTTTSTTTETRPTDTRSGPTTAAKPAPATTSTTAPAASSPARTGSTSGAEVVAESVDVRDWVQSVSTVDQSTEVSATGDVELTELTSPAPVQTESEVPETVEHQENAEVEPQQESVQEETRESTDVTEVVTRQEGEGSAPPVQPPLQPVPPPDEPVVLPAAPTLWASLSTFITEGHAIGSSAVHAVQGARAVQAEVSRVLVGVRDHDLRAIGEVFGQEFESLLGGRHFTVRQGRKRYEVRIRATLEPPTGDGVKAKTKVDLAVQSGSAHTENLTVYKTGDVGFGAGVQVVGGAVVAGGAKVAFATPGASQAITRATADQREIRSGEGVRTVSLPVAYEVTVLDERGADHAPPGTVRGEVELSVPDDLIGLTTPAEVVRRPGPPSELRFPVAEAVTGLGDDVFDSVASLVRRCTTELGAPGRTTLRDFLGPESVRDNFGAMLDGWVVSPPLASRHGTHASAVRMRVTPTGATLVGTTKKSALRLNETAGTSSTVSSYSKRGVDGSLLLGGGVDAKVARVWAGLGVNAAAHTVDTTAAGRTSTARSGLDLTGDVALYRMGVLVEVESMDGGRFATQAVAHTRIGLAEAADHGLPVPADTPVGLLTDGRERVEPPYLAEGLAAGSVKVSRFAGAERVLPEVRKYLAEHTRFGDLLPEWDVTGTGLKHKGDVEDLLSNERRLRDVLSPAALRNRMDALMGTGVVVLLKHRGALHHHTIQIVVKLDPKPGKHAGRVKGRAVRSGTTTGPALGSTSVTTGGVAAGPEVRVGAGGTIDTSVVGFAGSATAKVGRSRIRRTGAGPVADATVTGIGGGDSEVFEHEGALRISVSTLSRLNPGIRHVLPGAPGLDPPERWTTPADERPEIPVAYTLLVPHSLTTPKDDHAAEPVRPVPPTAIDPLPALPKSITEHLAEAPRPAHDDWLAVEAVLGTGTLVDAAVEALVEASDEDRVLTLPGSDARAAVDAMFSPENVKAMLRSFQHGTLGTDLVHPRRVRDRVGRLGARAALTRPELVLIADDSAMERLASGGHRVEDTSGRATGLSTGVSGTVSGARTDDKARVGAGGVTAKPWAKTTTRLSGRETTVTVDRKITAAAGTRRVLARFDLDMTVLAESRQQNAVHRPSARVAGRRVTLPRSVYLWLSEDQARAAGVLAPEPAGPAPRRDRLAPPPVLAPGRDGVLGLGAVERLPDLSGLVSGLDARLRAAGVKLLPGTSVDDVMNNWVRLLDLVSPSSLEALVDSALDGGAPLHAHLPKVFVDQGFQVVLTARVVGDPAFRGVVNDGRAVEHNTVRSQRETTVGSTSRSSSAGPRLGGQHKFGEPKVGIGGVLSAAAGTARMTTTTGITVELEGRQRTGGGPAARFDLPVRFELEVRRGTKVVARSESATGPLGVWFLADNLPPVPPVPRTDAGPRTVLTSVRRLPAEVEPLSEWRRDGLVAFPAGASVESVHGAGMLRDAARDALIRAGAGSGVTGFGTAALNVLWSSLSPQALHAFLPTMTSASLPVPVLRESVALGGVKATVEVHAKVVAPRLVGVSDGVKHENRQGTSSTTTAEGKRVDIGELAASAPTFNAANADDTLAAPINPVEARWTGEPADARGDGATMADVANVKPSGRTGLVRFDVEYRVVVRVGKRAEVVDVGLPGSADLRMPLAAAETLVGQPLSAAGRAKADAVAATAKAWREAEEKARAHLHEAEEVVLRHDLRDAWEQTADFFRDRPEDAVTAETTLRLAQQRLATVRTAADLAEARAALTEANARWRDLAARLRAVRAGTSEEDEAELVWRFGAERRLREEARQTYRRHGGATTGSEARDTADRAALRVLLANTHAQVQAAWRDLLDVRQDAWWRARRDLADELDPPPMGPVAAEPARPAPVADDGDREVLRHVVDLGDGRVRLDDPGLGADERAAFRAAALAIRPHSRYLTLVVGATGYTGDRLAQVALSLRRQGVWDGARPIRLVSSAGDGGLLAVAEAMVTGLAQGRDPAEGPVRVVVPSGPVWSVPGPEGASTGALVASLAVAAEPGEVPEQRFGSWTAVARTATSEITRTDLGGYLPESGRPEPSTKDDPERHVLQRDPDYDRRTADLEERIGALAYASPRATRAARTVVRRLHDVLRAAYPDHADEVHRAFLDSDVGSAGQVGDLTAEQFAAHVRTANLRELMTLVYNGGWCNASRSPYTLRGVLQDVIRERDWARAERVGLAVEPLKEQAAYLNGTTRTLLHALTQPMPRLRMLFDFDVFAAGNLIAGSATRLADGVEYPASIEARSPRPVDDRFAGGISVDPRGLAALGMALSERELALQLAPVDPAAAPAVPTNREGDVPPDVPGPLLPLAWLTGRQVFEVDRNSPWHEGLSAHGLRTVAGMSATSARLATVATLLGVEDRDGFTQALLGYMLPLHDHSLYEILGGTAMVWPRSDVDLSDGAAMYRSLPVIGLPEVARIDGGVLPHEAVYLARATSGDLLEPSRDRRVLAERRLAEIDRAAATATGAARSPLTGTDLPRAFSRAQLHALFVHNGQSFPLLDAFLRTPGPERAEAVRAAAHRLVDRGDLPPVLGVRGAVADSRAAVDARMPELLAELAAHTEVLADLFRTLSAAHGVRWETSAFGHDPVAGAAALLTGPDLRDDPAAPHTEVERENLDRMRATLRLVVGPVDPVFQALVSDPATTADELGWVDPLAVRDLDGGVWLDGPGVAGVLDRFPADDRYFSFVAHGDAAGRPVLDGRPLSARAVAEVLVSARERGAWDGVKPVRFATCEAGRNGAGSFAAEVLAVLHGRGVPATAVAPDGPVFLVPDRDNATAPGHLVVAAAVGVDASGRPVVVAGGGWTAIDADGAADRPPPDALPAGYTPAAAVADGLPGAFRFAAADRALFDHPRYPRARARYTENLGRYLLDRSPPAELADLVELLAISLGTPLPEDAGVDVLVDAAFDDRLVPPDQADDLVDRLVEAWEGSPLLDVDLLAALLEHREGDGAAVRALVESGDPAPGEQVDRVARMISSVLTRSDGWQDDARALADVVRHGDQSDVDSAVYAAKALFAFRLLGGREPVGFLHAVLGHVLGVESGTLRGALAGAAVSGLFPGLATTLTGDDADVFRGVPGLTAADRRLLGPLPHEQVYLAQLNDGGFPEAGPELLVDIRRRRDEFRHPAPTRVVAEWSARHDLAGAEVLDRLGLAHFVAIEVYTGELYQVINAVEEAGADWRPALRRTIRKQLGENPGSWPKTVKANARVAAQAAHVPAPGTPARDQFVDWAMGELAADLRALEEQVPLHAHLLFDALRRLPPALGGMWRGTKVGAGPEDFVRRALGQVGGAPLRAGRFTSSSRNEATARWFMTGKPEPALLRLETGGVGGYDIRPFSQYAVEDEVLLLPDAVLEVREHQEVRTPDGRLGHHLLTVREVGPDVPFPPGHPSGADDEPRRRRARANLLTALSTLDGGVPVTTVARLDELAARLGLTDGRELVGLGLVVEEVHRWPGAITADALRATRRVLTDVLRFGPISVDRHHAALGALAKLAQLTTPGDAPPQRIRRLLLAAKALTDEGESVNPNSLWQHWQDTALADLLPPPPDDVPPTPEAPPLTAVEQHVVDQLVAFGHDRVLLVDPVLDAARAAAVRTAVANLRPSDTYFTLAVYNLTPGEPTLGWAGREVDGRNLAHVLLRLREEGTWDGARPIRLAASGSAEPGEDESVAQDLAVELAAYQHLLAAPVRVLAPNGRLWATPDGDLVVAYRVGTSEGAVAFHGGDDAWLEFQATDTDVHWRPVAEHLPEPDDDSSAGPRLADDDTDLEPVVGALAFGPDADADYEPPHPVPPLATRDLADGLGVVLEDSGPTWVVDRFPTDDRFFTVVAHGDTSGRPVVAGRPLDADELAAVLLAARDRGAWDGVKPLMLVTCDSGRSDFAADLLAELRGAGVEATVLAPDGPVFFVPHADDETLPGHLVVTTGVGLDPTGRPVVATGGGWTRFAADGSSERLGAHVVVSDDGTLSTVDAPEGYGAVDPTSPVPWPVHGAVRFGAADRALYDDPRYPDARAGYESTLGRHLLAKPEVREALARLDARGPDLTAEVELDAVVAQVRATPGAGSPDLAVDLARSIHPLVPSTSGWENDVRTLAGVLGTAPPHVARTVLSTARALVSARRLGDVDPVPLLHGLLGRALTTGGGTVRDVLTGASVSGLFPAWAATLAGDDAARYRAVPGLSAADRRALGPLPHELVYGSHLGDGRFADLGPAEVEAATRRRDAFAALDDPVTGPWSRRHDLTGQEVRDRLGVVHFAAIGLYTGPLFSIVNALEEARGDRGAVVRDRFRSMLGPSPAHWPKVATANAAVRAFVRHRPPGEVTAAELDHVMRLLADDLVDLERQLALHAHLLADALGQLPPALGEVWRGTRIDRMPHAFLNEAVLHPDEPLPVGKFTSTSRDDEIGKQFLLGVEQPVLLRLHATGGSGVDIAPFSDLPTEAEVLLPPGAEVRVLEVTDVERDRARATPGHVLVTAEEVGPELPFPPSTSDDPVEGERRRRQARSRVLAATTALNDGVPVRRAADLDAVAQRVDSLGDVPTEAWVTRPLTGAETWNLALALEEVYRSADAITVGRLRALRAVLTRNFPHPVTTSGLSDAMGAVDALAAIAGLDVPGDRSAGVRRVLAAAEALIEAGAPVSVVTLRDAPAEPPSAPVRPPADPAADLVDRLSTEEGRALLRAAVPGPGFVRIGNPAADDARAAAFHEFVARLEPDPTTLTIALDNAAVEGAEVAWNGRRLAGGDLAATLVHLGWYGGVWDRASPVRLVFGTTDDRAGLDAFAGRLQAELGRYRSLLAADVEVTTWSPRDASAGIDRIDDSVIRMTGGGIWLEDPAGDPALTAVVGHLPVDHRFFTVTAHADDRGRPVLGGRPVTPAALAEVLTTLWQFQAWDSQTPLMFVSCSTGRPDVDGSFAEQVLEVLRAKGISATVVAPDGPVFFVPDLENPDGPGHLVVTSGVGVDAAGKPAVVRGGNWVQYASGAYPEWLGAHLEADSSSPVYGVDTPEGYAKVKTEPELVEPLDRAFSFTRDLATQLLTRPGVAGAVADVATRLNRVPPTADRRVDWLLDPAIAPRDTVAADEAGARAFADVVREAEIAAEQAEAAARSATLAAELAEVLTPDSAGEAISAAESARRTAAEARAEVERTAAGRDSARAVARAMSAFRQAGGEDAESFLHGVLGAVLTRWPGTLRQALTGASGLFPTLTTVLAGPDAELHRNVPGVEWRSGDLAPAVEALPGGVLLADPLAAKGTLDAVRRFPADDRYFTFVAHGDDQGRPVFAGRPVSARAVADLLITERDRGAWDPATPVMFVSCNAGRSFAADVLTALRALGVHATAVAPDGPVLFVPNRQDPDGPGHLVVANDVGFGADGRPLVVAGGGWLHLTPGEPARSLGAHLDPDTRAATEAPPAYATSSADDVVADLPGATRFAAADRALFQDAAYAPVSRQYEAGLGAVLGDRPAARQAVGDLVTGLAVGLGLTPPDAPDTDGVRWLLDPASGVTPTLSVLVDAAINHPGGAQRRLAPEPVAAQAAHRAQGYAAVLDVVRQADPDRAALDPEGPLRITGVLGPLTTRVEGWEDDVRAVAELLWRDDGPAAVARTVAEALHVFQVAGGVDPAGFLHGVLGRVLTAQPGSLAAALTGARVSGLFPTLPTVLAGDPADVYRGLPGLTPGELREAGDLPHERLYLEYLGQDLFAEAGEDEREAAADRRTAFADDAEHLSDWLTRHRLAGQDVVDRLGLAHFVAFDLYTGELHRLINEVELRPEDPRSALRDKIRAVLTLPEHAWPKLLQDNAAVEQAREAADPEDFVDEAMAGLEPQLDEITWEVSVHGHMLMDALRQLPPALGTVWRGTNVGTNPDTFEHRATTAADAPVGLGKFTSTSRDHDTALNFLATKDNPALLRVDLTGARGYDIAPFSDSPGEAEVLLLPDSEVVVTSHTAVLDNGVVRAHRVLTTTEVAPDLPFPPSDPDLDPLDDEADRREAHAHARTALATLGGGIPVVHSAQLAGLAQHLGVADGDQAWGLALLLAGAYRDPDVITLDRLHAVRRLLQAHGVTDFATTTAADVTRLAEWAGHPGLHHFLENDITRVPPSVVRGLPAHGGVWLADPDSADRTVDAVRRFPSDHRFFTFVAHGDDQGRPQLAGRPVSARAVADLLADARTQGVWDPAARPLMFATCNAAGTFAAEVLTELRARGITATAFAPNGPVYFVPDTTPTARGHLVVTSAVGLTATGHPAVLADGGWIRVAHDEPDQWIGAHVPPDATQAVDHPAGYDRVATPDELTADLPGAVRFAAADKALFTDPTIPHHTREFDRDLAAHLLSRPTTRAAVGDVATRLGAPPGTLEAHLRWLTAPTAAHPPDTAVAHALTAFRSVGGDRIGFLHGVLGHVLSTHPGALRAALTGALPSGLFPGLRSVLAGDPIEVYRGIPGVTARDLRAVGDLPHERVYLFHAENDVFAEITEDERNDSETRRNGFLTDSADVRPWLTRHLLTHQDVTDRLGPAHFLALDVYTGMAHRLINLMESPTANPRATLRAGLARLLAEKSPVDWPVLLKRAVIPASSDADESEEDFEDALPHPDTEERDAFVATSMAALEPLLPGIEREVALHSHMLADALRQLPPALGEVWRGTAHLDGSHTFAARATPGATIGFGQFTSTSHRQDVATTFFKPDGPTLIRLETTGRGGFHIEPFARLAEDEDEVLLLPDTHARILDVTPVPAAGYTPAHTLITAVELGPDLPFPPHTPGTADEPRRREARATLLTALTTLNNGIEPTTSAALSPLAALLGIADGRTLWQTAMTLEELHRAPAGLTLDSLATLYTLAVTAGIPLDNPHTALAHLDALARTLGNGHPTDRATRVRHLLTVTAALVEAREDLTAPAFARRWTTP
ncbi:hypothetical protein [Actinosynnema sp. NPDC020468]|uniref:WXG100-like domain-containing protein n=1 Tax=Actinosynnema sp. NPDC020468 TaxID=3154488 RepID=UPI00340D0F57